MHVNHRGIQRQSATRAFLTNQENGRAVEVRVIDRSASGARRPIIDLSRAAPERLDFIARGTVNVRTEVISWGRPSR